MPSLVQLGPRKVYRGLCELCVKQTPSCNLAGAPLTQIMVESVRFMASGNQAATAAIDAACPPAEMETLYAGDCRHLGRVLARVDENGVESNCQKCWLRVCEKYGVCTTATKRGGVRCCTSCPSWQADDNAPDKEESAPAVPAQAVAVQPSSRIDLRLALPSESKGAIKSWAVGMTTAPRKKPTVSTALSTAVRAGFTDGILFAEPDSLIPDLQGWRLVQRESTLGAFGNSMLALAELYYRNPTADAYLMLQDDIEFIDADVKAYLESVLWIGKNTAAVSLFTSNAYAQKSPGWYHFERQQWRWGACAWMFPNAFVRAVLADRSVIDHAANPRTGKRLVDHTIASYIRRQRNFVYFPWPSIVQHIGDTSTIWSERSKATGSRAATVITAETTQPVDRSFSHFVLTRFNTSLDVEIDGSRYVSRHSDEEWLRERVNLFETWTLPSVRQQTAAGKFRWLLLLDQNSPEWLRTRAATWTPAEPCYLPDALPAAIMDAINARGIDGKWLVTTRLDSDDAVAPAFVETIQKAFQPQKEAINLTNGLAYAVERVGRSVQGCNPFLTLVEPADRSAKTVLFCNHRHVRRKVDVRQVGGAPLWLQNVHGNNLYNHRGLTRGPKVTLDKAFACLRLTSPPELCLYDRMRPVFRRYRGSSYVITRERWLEIEPLLRPGMRTLETGCGFSTHLFTAIGCDHTAIEHESKWHRVCADGCKANLILAPLTGAPPWYDVDVDALGKFDFILVDGPQGKIGRQGVLSKLPKLCKPSTVVVFDDTNRPNERILAESAAKLLGYSINHRDRVSLLQPAI